MTLQFIHDTKGNTTGVFIPIEEWQSLKIKYSELQSEEVKNSIELSEWQKNIIDLRTNQYYENATDIIDFDKTIDEIGKGL
jgi:hypothetical protein